METNDEDTNEIILDYKNFVDNKLENNDAYNTYNTILEYIVHKYDNCPDSIPGYITISNILNFIKTKQYIKLYNLDCYAIHEEYINNSKQDDGIIVKNSLINLYDIERLIILYNSLFNSASALHIKIDIFMYYNSRLIKQNIFTYNIDFDKYEFFNRCTEDNFNFLNCTSLDHLKYHYSNGSSIKRIIETFTEINQKFSKGKKGFIYLFWIPTQQNKLSLY